MFGHRLVDLLPEAAGVALSSAQADIN